MDKAQLREVVRKNLDDIVEHLNRVLAGQGTEKLKPVLTRLGRGGQIPHWFRQLSTENTLPNLDGKTIGSIIEMLFVSILETHTLKDKGIQELDINPARGVDIPDLNLGIKSPSENFCTSEPFFSAYERLLGNDHDAVILLTDYQKAKKKPPLRVSIIDWAYMRGSEIADKNLCAIAKKHRSWLIKENESWAKKVFRFLAYINQSDWRAKQILHLIRSLGNDTEIGRGIKETAIDYKKQNEKRLSEGREPIPDFEPRRITDIASIKPRSLGVITAADDWIAENQKDFGRLPNDNEWARLRESPLDGKIGMSFALQWRYNFGLLFRKNDDEKETAC
jgi:hypothetical protein